MIEFIRKNKKSFPNYFRIGELKTYIKNNNLHEIKENNEIVGFYVLDGEMFKSLFISKNNRSSSRNLLSKVFSEIKQKNNTITIAVNPKSKRVVRLCNMNNFVATDKKVEGKTHILTIYKWVTN